MHRFLETSFSLSRVLLDPDITIDYNFGKLSSWSQTKKSQLIEGLLLHAPLPPIYVGTDTELNLFGEAETAIRMAVICEFISMNRFKLEGLKNLSELNGLRFKELDRGPMRRLSESLVRVIEVKRLNR